MSRIKEVTPNVRKVMTDFPISREDDRFLIYAVYVRCYGVRPDASFKEVMKRLDLPSFESIRRARQKIQETDESLRGSKESEDIRLAMQEEYLEYAREGA